MNQIANFVCVAPLPQKGPSSRYDQPAPAPRQDHSPRQSYERDPHRLSPTHPPSGYGHMSPPPVNQGPRPISHNRPPAASRPPPSPGPESGADPTLLPLFRAVDKDGSSC